MAALPLPDGSIVVTPGGPNNDLPVGPPGIWPSPGHPAHPIVLPPPPPGIWPPPVSIWPPTPLPPGHPMPPGSVWPPIRPVDPGYGVGVERPDQGLPGDQPHPDQGLPGVPGRPDHGLPSQKFLVAIVSLSAAGGMQVIGYTVVDPSLSPGHDLPGVPVRPDNTLPPTAQPK